MKKIAFLTVCALVAVAATAKTLPEKAAKFIEVAFPERTVLLLDAKVNYEVMLDDFTEIDFDSKGNWTEINAKKQGEIPDSAVPAKILESVNKHFQGQKIVKIERSARGNYEVELINDIEIKFNSDFIIIEIDK